MHSRASVRGSGATLWHGQVRYLELARNRIRFGVMCLAYNLGLDAFSRNQAFIKAQS